MSKTMSTVTISSAGKSASLTDAEFARLAKADPKTLLAEPGSAGAAARIVEGVMREALNPRTGEVRPTETVLSELRDLEARITSADLQVAACATALKEAKEEREVAVKALRDAVRGQQPLPLA